MRLRVAKKIVRKALERRGPWNAHVYAAWDALHTKKFRLDSWATAYFRSGRWGRWDPASPLVDDGEIPF